RVGTHSFPALGAEARAGDEIGIAMPASSAAEWRAATRAEGTRGFGLANATCIHAWKLGAPSSCVHPPPSRASAPHDLLHLLTRGPRPGGDVQIRERPSDRGSLASRDENGVVRRSGDGTFGSPPRRRVSVSGIPIRHRLEDATPT